MTNDAERDREDRGLFKKFNIKFRLPGDEWPAHHINSFQRIKAIGFQRFSTYPAADDETNDVFWKLEIKSHAQRLVDVASRLVGNEPSEMKWRLDLEAIIYKRFEWGIECPEPDCKGRLWRSEFEVVAEDEGPINDSIQERRKTRKACRCDAETRLRNHNAHGLNRIFDNRADDLVIYGGEAQSELRSRKPDRVYGLAQTKHFDRALERAAAAIAQRAVAGSTISARTNLVQTTPFEEKSRPLIFPFLISEAKSERGDSFDACVRQTAFPIWKFLRLQEQLQIDAKCNLVEQGGPLVWFFTNRGEDWRLYGCYIELEKHMDGDEGSGSSYNIFPIWSGRVDSPDGALQILLLVDYIFDWARDLYRPGILNLLKAISKNCVPDTTSISTDSEIHSLGPRADRIYPKERIKEWQEQMESTGISVPSPDPTDASQPLLVRWRTTNTMEGVFRHATTIETCFQCVFLTKDSIARIFDSLIDEGYSRLFLQGYARFILSNADYKISGDILCGLEEQWTGNKSSSEHYRILRTPQYALITYDIFVSQSWQPTRTIGCVIFDQSAIPELHAFATFTRWRVTDQKEWQGLKEISAAKLQSMVKNIRRIPMAYNLGAAIERKSLYLADCSRLYAGDEEKNADFVFLRNKSNHSSEFINTPNEISSKETIKPFVWSSKHIENQPNIPSSTDHEIGTEDHEVEFEDCEVDIKDCYPISRKNYSRSSHILVHRKGIRPSGQEEPAWCIFCVGVSTEPPDTLNQQEIVTEIASQSGNNRGFLTLASRVNLLVDMKSLKNPNSKPRQALNKWSKSLEHLITERMFLEIAREQPSIWSEISEYLPAVRKLMKSTRKQQTVKLSSPSKRVREDTDDDDAQDTENAVSQQMEKVDSQISNSKRIKIDNSILSQKMKKERGYKRQIIT